VADDKYQLYHTAIEDDADNLSYATHWRNFQGYSYTKPSTQELSKKVMSEYPTLTPSGQTTTTEDYESDPELLVNIQLSSIQNYSLTKKPDFDGLLSDTKYYFGYQLGMLVIIFFLPTEISKWDKDAKAGNLFSKYWYNITHPTWDSDEWYLNYVMHPYFGATYHVRARERGYGPMGGFYYSFLLSSLWEMGLEAFAEPVSIQDVFVTPFYGALVGEFFMQVRKNIKNKGRADRNAWNKFVLFITDPIGSLNNIFRRWTGWTTHMEVEPFHGSPVVRNKNRADPESIDNGYDNYDGRERDFRDNFGNFQSNSDIVGLNFKLYW